MELEEKREKEREEAWKKRYYRSATNRSKKKEKWRMTEIDKMKRNKKVPDSCNGGIVEV